jgi:RimJ/RimL family protein N-acetyltransferase
MSAHGINHPTLIAFPERIETPRLVLRSYAPGEGASLFEAIQRSREHLKKWVTWVDDFKTFEDQEAYVRKMQAAFIARTDLVWQIRLKHNDHFAGAMGLHEINWSIPSYSMGWWIATDCANQGYTKEAAAALAAVAMTKGQAQRLWATCDADNKASEAIMKHIGMQQEGLLREHGRKSDGRLRDTLLYARVSD